MPSRFGNDATVDHENPVGGPRLREPVRDNEGGAAAHRKQRRRLQLPRARRPRLGRRFIQNDKPRVLQQDPGQRQVLRLSGSELVAVITQDRLDPVVQGRDLAVRPHGHEGCRHLLVRRIRTRQGQKLPHRWSARTDATREQTFAACSPRQDLREPRNPRSVAMRATEEG